MAGTSSSACPASPQKVSFQKVDETAPGKNRLHLDLQARLISRPRRSGCSSAGAGLVQEHEMQGFHWNVFTDPDGNEFCVAQARASHPV